MPSTSLGSQFTKYYLYVSVIFPHHNIYYYILLYYNMLYILSFTLLQYYSAFCVIFGKLASQADGEQKYYNITLHEGVTILLI